MRVVITGAGMVGAHVARELLSAGDEVTLLDVAPRDDYIAAIAGPGARVARTDVAELPGLLEAVLAARPDVVVHTAALIGEAAQVVPYRGVTVNVMGTVNVAEVVRLLGIGRLVHASTLGVNDLSQPQTKPIDEDFPRGTSGRIYGASKVACEVLLDAYANAYGFTPPSRNPVERIPVQYLRYYPAVWYGLPGSTLPVVAPQVHMPTDTTQLGFYYQRVPTWAPVPGMIPGPPDPAYYNHYAYGIGGGMVSTTTAVDGSVSTGDPNVRIISSRPLGTTADGTTTTAPGTLPVPPAPSGSSALPLQPPPAPAAE